MKEMKKEKKTKQKMKRMLKLLIVGMYFGCCSSKRYGVYIEGNAAFWRDANKSTSPLC